MLTLTHTHTHTQRNYIVLVVHSLSACLVAGCSLIRVPSPSLLVSCVSHTLFSFRFLLFSGFLPDIERLFTHTHTHTHTEWKCGKQAFDSLLLHCDHVFSDDELQFDSVCVCLCVYLCECVCVCLLKVFFYVKMQKVLCDGQV